jgi:purine-nucleoside phosphorylase
MSTPDPSSLTPEGTRAYRGRVAQEAETIRERAGTVPSVAVLLPSRIASLDAVTIEAEWALGDGREETSTGSFAVATLGGTRVLLHRGGRSLREGHTPREVVRPARALIEAGADTLVLVAPAVCVAPDRPASLALVTDHINFQGANPLVGPNVEAWGPRFPDMTVAYAPALRRAAADVARRAGLPLDEGVYLATLGPGGGTRAERRMARRLGADYVGEGLVQEVIAARHMGARVLGVAVVEPASRADTDDATAEVRSRLQTLLGGVVAAAPADEKSV